MDISSNLMGQYMARLVFQFEIIRSTDGPKPSERDLDNGLL